MTGFSLANMDYTPVKFMIKCFEANYPESLGAVLVHKAPWVFQGVWSIIKGWLDPVVASKVHFASDEKELSQWVPKNRIPKDIGGDEPWTYQYVEPTEGEDAKMADTESRNKIEGERRILVEDYEKETIGWARGEHNGESRGRIAESLRSNYWTLDPYVRARSLYDRTGLLGPGGALNFYPGKAAPSSAAQRTSTSADDVD